MSTQYDASSQRSIITVFWYNLAGDYIGQLQFPASNDPGYLAANNIAIAAAHSTVIGGLYSGVTSGSIFGVPGPVATGGAASTKGRTRFP